MAEIVEYRLSKTLGEIEILTKFGFFDAARAKEVVKKREEFEYTLRRRTNDKLRFLKYIKFEINLLESIEEYRKNIASQSTEDELAKIQTKLLDGIVKSRVGHINFLFRKLVTKHQFDKRLWLAYIEFARHRKLNSRVSALYWRILRVSGKDVRLWDEAVDFEINTTQDLNTARKLIILGLRHHPDCKSLKDKLKSICDIQIDEGVKNGEDTPDVPPAADPQSTKPAVKQLPPNNMNLLYECYDSNGLEETRKLFESLEVNPRCQTLSLYVAMIQVETWQLKKDDGSDQLNRIRDIYDRALLKFGKKKAKLWYEYLQFEHQFARNLEDIQRISRLYTRAQATLDPCQVNRVIEKYTLMQTKAPSRTDIEFSDYSDLDE